MEKIYFFTLALCTLNVSYGQINFGIKAGVNISKPSIYSDFYRSTSWNENAGVYSQINLTTKFFLQPELLYSVESYNRITSGPVSIALKYSYLTVPVLLGYIPFKHFAILAGSEFSYLLNATIKFGHSEKYNLTDNYSRFDNGIDLGINYRINKKLGVWLYYNYGIKNVKQYYSDDYGNRFSDNILKNRLLQVGLNCSF